MPRIWSGKNIVTMNHIGKLLHSYKFYLRLCSSNAQMRAPHNGMTTKQKQCVSHLKSTSLSASPSTEEKWLANLQYDI